MTQKDLKYRFDKLTQLKVDSVETAIVGPRESAQELPATLHPTVFAAIESSSSTPINWKKLLKKDMIRPDLEAISNQIVMDVQSTISSLVTTPVLVTIFSPSTDAQNSMRDFAEYLQRSRQFWSTVLVDSSQVHIRFKNNKTQLWMRKNSLTAITLQDLRLKLDQEFRKAAQLKTYSTNCQEEWIELTIEIAASRLNSQHKEISV